jgi:hypothetical protein
MRRIIARVAVAAVLGALALPALGADDRAAKQDCTVCNDPTFPQVENPMPAIGLPYDDGSAAASLRADPNQPEVRQPAPAIALGGPLPEAAPTDLSRDPNWPAATTARLAPALVPGPEMDEYRAARR